MRKYRRRFLYVAVPLLTLAFAWFMYGAIQASRRARENFWREFEENNYRVNVEWAEREKRALVEHHSGHLYFYSTRRTDLLVQRFEGMAEIKSLNFWSTDITDQGLGVVAALPNLKKLTVCGGHVSDARLKLLSQHQSLETLHLVNTGVTNSGLAALQSIPRLTNLTIYSTAHGRKSRISKELLTEAAIPELASLTQLKKLNIGGGWLSNSVIDELKKRLPDCEIVENYADDEW